MKSIGCFQRRLFVCLFNSLCVFVCLFVCQHDNFRLSKHRMMKLRVAVQKSQPSSNSGVIAPWVHSPQNVALGYDVGTISAGCLVLVLTLKSWLKLLTVICLIKCVTIFTAYHLCSLLLTLLITCLISDHVVTTCHFLPSKSICFKIASLCEFTVSRNRLVSQASTIPYIKIFCAPQSAVASF